LILFDDKVIPEAPIYTSVISKEKEYNKYKKEFATEEISLEMQLKIQYFFYWNFCC